MTARTFSVEIVNATDVSAAVATTNAWVLGSKVTYRRVEDSRKAPIIAALVAGRYPSIQRFSRGPRLE